ncbi:MAG: hypothetical protein KC731_02685 [Myxococcales bacterium]|nr:hypothetical protein [Myxococcales bacterium]
MKYFPHLVALTVMGCSSTPSSPTQTVRGQAAVSSFPSTIEEVRVDHGGVTVASSAVDAQGHFELAIPIGSGYRLSFVTSNDVALVFPRSGGSMDSQFDVEAAGTAFDLGMVRYLGDPKTTQYAFSGTSEAPGSECEDGIDPTTGFVCVDDDQVEGCGEGNDTEDNGADGEVGDDSSTVTLAAVADHNLPSTMGCAEGEDHDCEDGIDPATGLECDGGPSANGNDGA